jgi:hypothetical protein
MVRPFLHNPRFEQSLNTPSTTKTGQQAGESGRYARIHRQKRLEDPAPRVVAVANEAQSRVYACRGGRSEFQSPQGHLITASRPIRRSLL